MISDWGRAVAAGSSALAVYIFVDGCWAYRRRWWFWVLVAAVSAVQLSFVYLVRWPDWGKNNLWPCGIAALIQGFGLQQLVVWLDRRIQN
jgi:hypothetical protein